MTVALARRLVQAGVVSPRDVEAALTIHVAERVAFLRALLRRHPEIEPRLNRELARSAARRVSEVRVEESLMQRLPHGLSEALLAVPIGTNAERGTAVVAVADPSDAHLVSEMSYQLGFPVELVFAPLRTLLRALGEPAPELGGGEAGGYTPAFGTPVRSPSSAPPAAGRVSQSAAPALRQPSDRPIPLVRVHSSVPASPATRKGVAPQHAGQELRPSPVVVPPRRPVEPVIELTRSKPPSAPAASSGGLEGVEDAVSRALAAIGSVETADEVTDQLARGLGALGRTAVVFRVKSGAFQVRATSGRHGDPHALELTIPADRPSVLLTATEGGRYLGPLPRTPVHEPLGALLGEGRDEIAVETVAVSGRPVLISLIAGFESAYLVTRRSEELARAAGVALERIVRGRKSR